MKERNSSRHFSQSVTITLVALILWFGFQLSHLWSERAQVMSQIHASATTAEKSTKLKAQLEMMAGKTAQLASQGNKNAQAIVQAFKAQGVQLHQAGKP